MDMSNAISQDEKKIIQALRNNSQLFDSVIELTEISENKTNNLKLGDQAEEATVNAVQKTGKAVLEGWAERRKDEVTGECASEKDNREHEKKNSLANLLWNDRD